MPLRGRPLFAVLALALATQAWASQRYDRPASGGRSPRNANYDIEVTLDPGAHRLHGRERISWRNISARATLDLRFHLYWNAWRNADSTFMREQRLSGSTTRVRTDGWSTMEVTGLRVQQASGASDLTARLAFIAPDDGNASDHTVATVVLPTPVEPQDTVTIDIDWVATVPRTFARTGYRGDYYFIGQWFPKIGVLEDQGWNVHQFHAGTEFYADYGVYDVRITAPRAFVVGATGVEADSMDRPDGTSVHHFRASDVHDFAWVASPRLVVRDRSFEEPGLPTVRLRLLLQPEHRDQEDRFFSSAAAGLRTYGRWFGPYPYAQLTIVDAAYQSGSGGMEYPTLVTASTRWRAPRDVMVPESAVAHEVGHQFWYGLVGSNEVEHAWMDEGLTHFSESRLYDTGTESEHLSRRFFGGIVSWTFPDIGITRPMEEGVAAYRRDATAADLASPTYRSVKAAAYTITYDKTALWLHTLERWLGWPWLQSRLADYFTAWTFRHPDPADLLGRLTRDAPPEVSAFNAAAFGNKTFDYAVETLTSTANATGGFHTTVVATRRGEATFPIDVATTFDDGSTRTEHWNGADRQVTYVYDSHARATSAQVDPGRVLMLDTHLTNNSLSLHPRRVAASTKWSLTWMGWLQDLLLTFASLV